MGWYKWTFNLQTAMISPKFRIKKMDPAKSPAARSSFCNTKMANASKEENGTKWNSGWHLALKSVSRLPFWNREKVMPPSLKQHTSSNKVEYKWRDTLHNPSIVRAQNSFNMGDVFPLTSAETFILLSVQAYACTPENPKNHLKEAN